MAKQEVQLIKNDCSTVLEQLSQMWTWGGGYEHVLIVHTTFTYSKFLHLFTFSSPFILSS